MAPSSLLRWLSVFVATTGAFVILWAVARANHLSETGTTANETDPRDDEEKSDDVDEPFELPPQIKRELEKERRRQAKIPLLAMKKPMYDNIRMLDPLGELLCTISQKKANWYINRGLAKWQDPALKVAIQLLFEPSHRSNRQSSNVDDKGSNATFNKSLKDNICVVCGDDQYHMRHYIVPYTIRSLLPNKYKMHMAHDVVILCPDDHLQCKKMATKRLKYFEQKFRKDPATAKPAIVHHGLYKVRSCALALTNWKDSLPQDTIRDYETVIRIHFQQSQNSSSQNGPDDELRLSPQLLQQATDMETQSPNSNYIPASQLIVQCLCANDNAIETFVRGWRQHFVETMQPQFMPQGWSIDSPVQSQSGERNG